MATIYTQQYTDENGVIHKVKYDIYPDKSIYRIEGLFVEDHKVGVTMCKVLDNVKDYTVLKRYRKLVNDKVIYDDVVFKGSDTLDIYKVAQKKKKISFKLNNDIMTILEILNDKYN